MHEAERREGHVVRAHGQRQLVVALSVRRRVDPFEMVTSAPAIGWLLLEFVTVPVRSPCGPAVQFGNLNDPIRVFQSATLVVCQVLGREPERAAVGRVDLHCGVVAPA